MTLTIRTQSRKFLHDYIQDCEKARKHPTIRQQNKGNTCLLRVDDVEIELPKEEVPVLLEQVTGW